MSLHLRRLAVAIPLALIGTWFTWALLDGRTKNLGPPDPLVAGVLFVGSTLLAPMPYLTGISATLGAASATFWEISPRLVIPVMHVATAVSAAFAWNMIIVLMFLR